MGTWGFELYQNDIALDVKDEFEELFNTGKSAVEITDKMIENYKSIMGDPDEEPMFWIALADTQWNLGVLLPVVKDKALCWIDKVCNVDNGSDDESAVSQRKTMLSRLSVKLNSPYPDIKKPKRNRLYKCQWQFGDVFAYQLESEPAKEKGLYGRYFLIQKVDECTWYPGHIVPIVYIKITETDHLPNDLEEYNRAEYVQTWFARYEERFWPIDMSRPQEDVAEKSAKQKYITDEYGFLPEYRVALLNTSKNVIPKKLIYVGNFVKADPPKNEFVPHSKNNIVSVSWKRSGEAFEIDMIENYCGHNLRELSIYKS